ncbi:MAG: GNAT family N-acetyltransferase [Desulfurococcales archaeon]|nr:GNAT family N-acetyltransferase [Desulfurococcales archaeon]
MEKIENLLTVSKTSGYRGLIIVTDEEPREALETLVDLLNRDCLLLAEKPLRIGRCRRELSPARYTNILGGEYSYSIIATRGLLRPNIVAAVGETVRRGGALIIAGPDWESWEPGLGRGLYKQYLKKMIPMSQLHIWINNGEIFSQKIRLPSNQPETTPRNKPPCRLPREIRRHLKTSDQGEALCRIYRFLTDKRLRSFMLKGDRGRGKSYTLGLILVLLAYNGMTAKVSVVSPSRDGIEIIKRAIKIGAQSLGLKIKENNTNLKISGLKISFHAPGTPVEAELLIVDEAASIGIARLRRLAWRSNKIILSTTIHGYEGSGTVLARLLEKILPSPIRTYEMRTPVRYLAGDPLEEWLYDTFMLKIPESVIEIEETRQIDNLRIVEISGNVLINDTELLRRIYSLLLIAHYRNQPDHLLLILEDPYRAIYTAWLDNDLLGVAEIISENIEENGGPSMTVDILERILPSRFYQGIRIARISRIAVHPRIQRRGIGSLFLRRLEDELGQRGISLVSVMFGRNDILGFWTANEYLPFYMSPRFNKVTGEKNIAVIKSIGKASDDLVVLLNCLFRRRLLYSARSLYRDVYAETIRELLKVGTPCSFSEVGLDEYEKYRLGKFLEGDVGYEQVEDILYKILVCRVLTGRLDFDDETLLLISASLVQGRGPVDVSRITGLSISEIRRKLEEVGRILASRVVE